MISGTEYYRRKARLSLLELSRRTGITAALLRKMCNEPPMSTSTDIYMRAAAELGVKVMDLLEQHDESELDVGDHTAYPSRTDRMTNCVAVYRRAKGLTYAQLARQLGSPNRQCAQLACSGEKAGRKHVRLLAAHEGITPEQFRQMYTQDTEVA